MASAAQILANRANAQASTGPRTAEGKARSARNNTKHGFATGLLAIADHEFAAFCEFEANLKEAARPQGALERETCNQLLHAAWRLHSLHGLMRALYVRLQTDPLVAPDAAAELRQLTRYRATLEMAFYRALKQLRDLQTLRAARLVQLHPPEHLLLPAQLEPRIYAAASLGYGDRGLKMEQRGLIGARATHRVTVDEDLQGRVEPIHQSAASEFTNSNPIRASRARRRARAQARRVAKLRFQAQARNTAASG